MRLSARYVIYIFAVILAIQCKKDIPETPPINDIPDPILLNALIERGIDTNGDGIISPAEAEAVDYLNIASCSISIMKGIELFVNLEILDCSNNQINSLDISQNTNLKELYCSDNQLTSLNVSSLTGLEVLICNGNQLTSLDLSNISSIGHDVGYELTYWSKYYYCYLSIGDMPGLEKVCVWTMPFPPEGVKLCTEGSPNVYFTADCSM